MYSNDEHQSSANISTEMAHETKGSFTIGNEDLSSKYPESPEITVREYMEFL